MTFVSLADRMHIDKRQTHTYRCVNANSTINSKVKHIYNLRIRHWLRDTFFCPNSKRLLNWWKQELNWTDEHNHSNVPRRPVLFNAQKFLKRSTWPFASFCYEVAAVYFKRVAFHLNADHSVTLRYHWKHDTTVAKAYNLLFLTC